MDNATDNNKLNCKLTTPELQARKKTVIQQLKDRVLERVEIGSGVKYKFEGSDGMIDLLTDFIKTERLCCNFFEFNMRVLSTGELWLELTGPEGAKDFISKELDF